MDKNNVVGVKDIILRLACRGAFEFLGDKKIASLIYCIKTGEKLDWKNPKTFNQKLQWLKVYDQNPIYTEMVDKIAAKKVVSEIIGEEHIVPLLGQWDSADDINYSELPKQFVLKCNHDQGSVVVVADKKSLDIEQTKEFLNYKLKRNNYYTTREFGYKNIKPQVFAEKFLGKTIKDYKFYCFNGEPKFLYVGQGLTADHSLKIDYFDMNWEPMPFYRTDYERLGSVPRPNCFEEMKEIAKKLSQNVPFVRIDLFEEEGKVYFSEFSPCPASGYMPFVPEQYDEIVGGWLRLEKYDKKLGKYISL